MLHIAGYRTQSRLNAFELIVTVAFGSMLAATILTKNVALADGHPGLGMLGFNGAVSKLSLKFRALDDLI